MTGYMQLPELAGFFLEESYVLDVEAHPGSVILRMDFVLTAEHPQYRDPAPNNQFCYRRGRMEFLEVKRLLWTDQGAPPAFDATGETDYGNIDRFEFDALEYVIEGGLGRLDLRAANLRVTLDPEVARGDRT